MDMWNAIDGTGGAFAAGGTLVILGATFRWFEPICRLLGRVGMSPDPFSGARRWIAERRAAGDEVAAARAEERIRDQQNRMTRYGSIMMLVGAIIVGASIFTRVLTVRTTSGQRQKSASPHSPIRNAGHSSRSVGVGTSARW